MGLFDIFKKKLPTHSEKVDLAYRCYKPEMVGMIYPGGKAQADSGHRLQRRRDHVPPPPALHPAADP